MSVRVTPYQCVAGVLSFRDCDVSRQREEGRDSLLWNRKEKEQKGGGQNGAVLIGRLHQITVPQTALLHHHQPKLLQGMLCCTAHSTAHAAQAAVKQYPMLHHTMCSMP